MKSFAFSDLNRQSGEVLDAALAAPVTLTKHGKPKLVLMRAEDYERLTATRAYSIYDAPDHIIAELQAGLDDILAEKS